MKAEKTSFYHPKSIVETRSVGPGTRVWAFAHILKGAKIGADCNIGDHSFIESGAVLGDRVTIKNGVSVWEGVTLEDDVFVGPNAAFTNDLFPVSRKRPAEFIATKVSRGACIGANATVVCGHTVGRYAFIGAGAVVTQDIPDFALALGNPARVRSYLCACRKKLSFAKSKARCSCGKRYVRSGREVRTVS